MIITKYPTLAMEDDAEENTNFFQLSKEEQESHSIPTIANPLFEVFAPKRKGQLKDIAWQVDFEDNLGIVDYTMVFKKVHERRGIVVARHTVELSWLEKVVKRFDDDKEKQHFFVLQLNCALINDCWVRGEFDIEKYGDSLIEDPNGVRDATALRVVRCPETVKGQISTIMLLHDNDVGSDDMLDLTKMKTADLVILPFLGLHVLKNISYLDIAAQVRRGDGKPLDEGLMKAVWRGVIFNMFYFEDEEFKLEKLAEEVWTSVQQPRTDAGGSPRRKRKLEER